MTTSDWILLSQTVVMLLTGVVVLWYTIETRRLRQDAAHQNKLIAAQLGVMQQSLSVMQDSLQFELRREVRESEPFFRVVEWGSIQWTDVHCEFRNEGGSIHDLEIAADPAVNPTISRTYFLRTGETTTVTFRSEPRGRPTNVPLPEKFHFQIRYKTNLNASGAHDFEAIRDKGITRIEVKRS